MSLGLDKLRNPDGTEIVSEYLASLKTTKRSTTPAVRASPQYSKHTYEWGVPLPLSDITSSRYSSLNFNSTDSKLTDCVITTQDKKAPLTPRYEHVLPLTLFPENSANSSNAIDDVASSSVEVVGDESSSLPIDSSSRNTINELTSTGMRPSTNLTGGDEDLTCCGDDGR